MRNHKTGCNACNRRVCCCPRPVRRPQSSCICPPGPPGPMGPPGPPGSNAVGDGSNTEKSNGVLTIPAELTLLPNMDFGIATFLVDGSVSGVGYAVQGVPTPLVPAGPAASRYDALLNLTTPPTYPATPDGITWDALAATLKSVSETPINISDGVAVVVQLVRNAGQPTEDGCIELLFSQPGGFNIVPITNGPPLYGSVEDLCFIAPGETYDVRVGLRNLTQSTITLAYGAPAAIEVSVTARSVSS